MPGGMFAGVGRREGKGHGEGVFPLLSRLRGRPVRLPIGARDAGLAVRGKGGRKRLRGAGMVELMGQTAAEATGLGQDFFHAGSLRVRTNSWCCRGVRKAMYF